MKMATVRTAAEELGVSEQTIRRMIRAGKLSVMMLGSRHLVDVDEARELVPETANGVTISEVSAQTGLTVTAIRRGVREGWIPCDRRGKTFYFDLQTVTEAIKSRMTTR